MHNEDLNIVYFFKFINGTIEIIIENLKNLNFMPYNTISLISMSALSDT